MAKEERTLEIVARVKDQITKTMKKMARTVGKLIKTGFLAPFKLLGRALKGITTSMLGFAGALGSVFLVWRGGSWVTSVIEATDAMNKLAQATNTNVESLSELEAAFQFSGLTVEQFRAVITSLGRAASATLNATSPGQASAFNRLGVSLDMLRKGDATAIFEQMARGMQQFETQGEKVAALFELFPDNAQRMVVLLGDLEEGFLKNVSAARAFGAGISSGLAQIATETQDDLLKLKLLLNNIARQGILDFAKEMAPVLRGLVEFLRMNRESLSGALTSGIRLLADAIFFLVKALVWLANNLPALGRGIGMFFEDKLGNLPVIGEKVKEFARDILGADGFGGIRDKMAEAALEMVKAQKGLAAIDKAGHGDNLALFAERVKKAREELRKLNDQITGQDSARQRASGGKVDETEIAKAIDRAQLAYIGELLSQVGGAGGFADFDPARVGSKLPAIARDRVQGKDKGKDIVAVESDFVRFFSTFDDGIKDALRGWEDFEKAGRQAGTQLVDSLGNNLAQAFTDIITKTKSAKEAFSDMARAILADIARIISRLIAMQIVESTVGALFAGGGVTRGVVKATVPAKSFARGGIVDRPTLALFGEAGQEAFVPLASGKIPVRLENSPSRVPEMNITIHAMDGADVRRVLTRERGFLRDLQLNALISSRQMRETVKGAAR